MYAITTYRLNTGLCSWYGKEKVGGLERERESESEREREREREGGREAWIYHSITLSNYSPYIVS